jgi:hypothetical protein
MGRDLGRRDDLWSSLCCIIELRRGTLPWNAERDKDRMGDMKRGISMQELCQGLSEQFVAIGEAIVRMEYVDGPNYGELAALIEEAMRVGLVSDDDSFIGKRFRKLNGGICRPLGLSREKIMDVVTYNSEGSVDGQ